MDISKAAYKLKFTYLTNAAILSPYAKLDVQYNVDVQNSAPPFDEISVKGWQSQGKYGHEFHYYDGQTDRIVSQLFHLVKANAMKAVVG